MKVFFLAVSLLSVNAVAAPKAKVNVCHFSSDEGSFRLINIAQPAVQAHINHGDVVAPAAGATVQAQLSNGVIITLDAGCNAVG